MSFQYDQDTQGSSSMAAITQVSISHMPIKYQRLLRGWTQQEVADELYRMCSADGRCVGINADVVGRWERGCARPSPLYQKYLCKLYGLNTEQLGLLK